MTEPGFEEFEKAIEKRLGEELRSNDEFGTELWSALANVDWFHPADNLEAGYSFRAAGGMIAEIIGKGQYLDWYCSGPYATVSNHIAHALRKEGWIYDVIGRICDDSDCIAPATCGTPTQTGYRNTCGSHRPDRDKDKM